MGGWASKWIGAAALGALAAVASPSAADAATFKVVAADRAGDGFLDETPRAPVGGNPGITLGAQRLNVIRYAASIWGAQLRSDVVIRLGVDFGPFESSDCSPSSALLGYAGPASAFANFVGAPRLDTMYASALADSLAHTDLNPGGVDISAAFNQDVDDGCFVNGAPGGWYYGYDNNPPPGKLNLLQTVLHELVHGLGFASFVGVSGSRCCGNQPMDDAFMLNLEWHEAGLTWPFLTDEERLLSTRSVDGLHWVGANVRAASSLLSAGRTGDHVHMYAPATYEAGASVSHFDTSLFPNELLEPFLARSVMSVLAAKALEDLGWSLVDPAPPTPSATMVLTAEATPTATAKPPTSTPPEVAMSTATSTPSPTHTVRRSLGCECDCDEDGRVSIHEVQMVANIYLNLLALDTCPNSDQNGDGSVSINEVQRAGGEFLQGCP